MATSSAAPATARGPEPRASLGRLALLIGDVVSRLDGAVDPQLGAAIAECNGAIEGCLDMQRDVDREDRVATASDELKRLARLLTTVDRADAPFVMRQIRRVLGRFDARA